MVDQSPPHSIKDHRTAPSDLLKPPMVGILLCTYNGETYLKGQIESFIAQSYEHWQLFVSDDGSTDGTGKILQDYQALLGENMFVFNGPKEGFAQNFMSLIRNKTINCDYYAFSDQDDIWLPDKLERSLAALANNEQNAPSLYCSRTQHIDSEGNLTSVSPSFIKPPSFSNALVQSLAGANTMLINESARKLLARTDLQATVIAHDWLAYLIVSGCGGLIVFDQEPTLLYRQHGANIIGANTGIQNRIRRVRDMLGGMSKYWNEKNLLILREYTSELTPHNRLLLGYFEQLRKSNLWTRLFLVKKARLYRQTLAGTISLYVAVALNQL
ncbi:glycosyltransferase family 2 protein [Pseudomonas folii]|nr:glycosyltransferase family 2 protein [Pseudomonas folii]